MQQCVYLDSKECLLTTWLKNNLHYAIDRRAVCKTIPMYGLSIGILAKKEHKVK